MPALVLHLGQQRRLAPQRGRAGDPVALGQHAHDLGMRVLADLADQRAAIRLGHPVICLDPLVGVDARLEAHGSRVGRLGSGLGGVQALRVHGVPSRFWTCAGYVTIYATFKKSRNTTAPPAGTSREEAPRVGGSGFRLAAAHLSTAVSRKGGTYPSSRASRKGRAPRWNSAADAVQVTRPCRNVPISQRNGRPNASAGGARRGFPVCARFPASRAARIAPTGGPPEPARASRAVSVAATRPPSRGAGPRAAAGPVRHPDAQHAAQRPQDLPEPRRAVSSDAISGSASRSESRAPWSRATGTSPPATPSLPAKPTRPGKPVLVHSRVGNICPLAVWPASGAPRPRRPAGIRLRRPYRLRREHANRFTTRLRSARGSAPSAPADPAPRNPRRPQLARICPKRAGRGKERSVEHEHTKNTNVAESQSNSTRFVRGKPFVPSANRPANRPSSTGNAPSSLHGIRVQPALGSRQQRAIAAAQARRASWPGQSTGSMAAGRSGSRSTARRHSWTSNIRATSASRSGRGAAPPARPPGSRDSAPPARQVPGPLGQSPHLRRLRLAAQQQQARDVRHLRRVRRDEQPRNCHAPTGRCKARPCRVALRPGLDQASRKPPPQLGARPRRCAAPPPRSLPAPCRSAGRSCAGRAASARASHRSPAATPPSARPRPQCRSRGTARAACPARASRRAAGWRRHTG